MTTEKPEFVRCSLVIEKVKFFSNHTGRREPFTEWDKILFHAREKFKIFSQLDLSYTESKVLFALQTWLCNNLSQRAIIDVMEDEKYKDLIIPVLRRPKYSELMEIMGYERKATRRNKMEFMGSDRERVANAMLRLTRLLFYYLFDIKQPGKTYYCYAVENLWEIRPMAYEAFKFLPSKVLLEGLDCNYYLSKPADLYQRAETILKQEMGGKKANKYVIRVLEWVILQSFLNRYKQIIIRPSSLADLVGLMENYWEKGKKKVVYTHLETGFELASKMQYISKFETTGGKFHSCYSFLPNREVLYPGGDKKASEGYKNKDFQYIPTQSELQQFRNSIC